MKTMKIWRNILVMTIAVLSLASCDKKDPDGKWTPMDWEAEVPVQITDGVYNVSAAGSEFTFACQNYSKPWIADALFNGKYYHHELNAGTNDTETLGEDAEPEQTCRVDNSGTVCTNNR